MIEFCALIGFTRAIAGVLPIEKLQFVDVAWLPRWMIVDDYPAGQDVGWQLVFFLGSA
ncbi:MAG: hypothetical protein SGI77_00190 [Pirellulaceae bacterium]|nr:hypothetical protein [Pirellulaceae bacterium]